MHLAEGVLPLPHASLCWLGATAALAWSLRGERYTATNLVEHEESYRLLRAASTSLLFAVTLFPMPVPVAGATSHICLTPCMALLLGPRRVVPPTFFVLLLQALFFAHGGITTLGANTLTLGLVGPVCAMVTWRGCRWAGSSVPWAVAVACGMGDIAVYLTDAALVAWALAEVSPPQVTAWLVVGGFAPVQLPLAVLEGVTSAALVRMLGKRRPELLPLALRERTASPGSGLALLLLVLLPILPLLAGCGYRGLDDSVFGDVAAAAGRAPRDPLLNFGEGEVGLAGTIVILFGAGFFVGRAFERLFGSRR